MFNDRVKKKIRCVAASLTLTSHITAHLHKVQPVCKQRSASSERCLADLSLSKRRKEFNTKDFWTFHISVSETAALLAVISAFVEEHAAHRQKPFLVSTDKRESKNASQNCVESKKGVFIQV